jgi:hypothetical protein
MRCLRIMLAAALVVLSPALRAQSAGAAPSAPTTGADAVMVLHRQIDISAMKAATVPYGTAGRWSVRIDQVAGYGCFIAAQYDNALGIRFQFSPGDNSNVIYVGSSNWRSIKEGDKKDMSLSFEGQNTWSGAAIGMDVQGMHWLTLKASGAAIFEEMKDAAWFALKIDGLELGVYETGEIARAVTILKECQAVADKAVDPFAAKAAAGPIAGPKTGPETGPVR